MKDKALRFMAGIMVACVCATLLYAMTGDFNVTGNTVLNTADVTSGTWETLTVKYLTGETTVTIPDGTVTTDKLGSGAVTADKLYTAAVTTDKLASGAITTSKLGPNAVTYISIYGLEAITTQKVLCFNMTNYCIGVLGGAAGSDGEASSCTCM